VRCHGFGTIDWSKYRLHKSMINLHSHFTLAGFEWMGGTDVMSLVLSHMIAVFTHCLGFCSCLLPRSTSLATSLDRHYSPTNLPNTKHIPLAENLKSPIQQQQKIHLSETFAYIHRRLTALSPIAATISILRPPDPPPQRSPSSARQTLVHTRSQPTTSLQPTSFAKHHGLDCDGHLGCSIAALQAPG
jgi:hypothetical protein